MPLNIHWNRSFLVWSAEADLFPSEIPKEKKLCTNSFWSFRSLQILILYKAPSRNKRNFPVSGLPLGVPGKKAKMLGPETRLVFFKTESCMSHFSMSSHSDVCLLLFLISASGSQSCSSTLAHLCSLVLSLSDFYIIQKSNNRKVAWYLKLKLLFISMAWRHLLTRVGAKDLKILATSF